MKIWYRVTITFTMLLVIFALLITGFQLAVYGDSHYGFYKKEYEKYRVTDDLNMKIDNVMAVTEHMMAYLIGKEEKLSIVTDVDGEHQDFFNEQDRLHLADVRNLFLGGLKLRNYAVILATILMIVLRAKKADFRRLVPLGYLQALFVYLILAAILGVAMSIDFTSCFTLFHKLFFTNNLWIFDPEIRLYDPHAAGRIFLRHGNPGRRDIYRITCRAGSCSGRVQLEMEKRKKLVKLIKGFKYINFNNNGGYVTMK